MTKPKRQRAELHPATDQWMQGDRFGDIIAIQSDGVALILMDKSKKQVWARPNEYTILPD